MSWGRVDNLLTPTKTVVLQKLQRIQSRKTRWDKYLDNLQKDCNTNKPTIGGPSFLLLCRELMSCDEFVLSCRTSGASLE